MLRHQAEPGSNSSITSPHKEPQRILPISVILIPLVTVLASSAQLYGRIYEGVHFFSIESVNVQRAEIVLLLLLIFQIDLTDLTYTRFLLFLNCNSTNIYKKGSCAKFNLVNVAIRKGIRYIAACACITRAFPIVAEQ